MTAVTKHDLLEFLINVRRAGRKVVGFGVAAKGNVMHNCCGIRGDLIDYLVDRSPYKCGNFAPGSRLEIRDVDQISVTRPDYMLILSWNIKEEIVGQLAAITRVGRALCRRGTLLGSFVTLAREGARASRPTQQLREGDSLSATPVNTRDADD